MNRTLVIVAWVVCAALSSAVGNLMLKRATVGLGEQKILGLMASMWFWGGILFFIINFVFFTLLLEQMPLTIAYPLLTGVVFVTLAVAGWWFFAEQLAMIQYIGMGLILIGIVLLTQK